MKEKGFTPIIVVIALLVLGGIVGMFYLSKQTNITSQPQLVSYRQATVISQVPPSSASQQDETANWKTYSSSSFPSPLGRIKIQYQVKVPSNVTVKPHHTTDNYRYLGDDIIQFYFPSPCTAQCQFISMSITQIPPGMNGFKAIEGGYSHNGSFPPTYENTFRPISIGGLYTGPQI